MTHSLIRRTVLVALALLPGAPDAGSAQAKPGSAFDGPGAHTLSAERLQPPEPVVSLGRPLFLHQPLVSQVQERKSPYAAFGLEFLLPVLGHGYAGDAGRGVLPAVVHVGGFMAMIALQLPDDLPDDDPRCEHTGPGRWNCKVGKAFWVGFGAFVGGKIWGLVSAVQTANDHNRSVESENTPTLSLLPTPDGRLGVGVSFRF